MAIFVSLSDKGKNSIQLSLNENLPSQVIGPVFISGTYEIQQDADACLLTCQLLVRMKFVCQRCLEEAETEFEISNTLALCQNDAEAEKIMRHYEPVVIASPKFPLEPILLDELFLSAPLKHPESPDGDCLQGL